MSDHLSSGSDGEIVVNPETPAMDIDDSSSGSDEEIFDQPESLKGVRSSIFEQQPRNCR